MVNGIQGGGGFDSGQLKAMLQRMQESKQSISGQETVSKPSEDFADAVVKNLAELEKSVRSADNLPADVVNGDLDFHEVAARIKESELTFDFAMKVRNKLIDAYREVMRMSV
ncbi:MAG: flagellar hook-basal body complex protein FliE [Planctomycetota bacterium]|jgi:flagellar hook-basal body complex protein FliE